ncbi:MBL fold metallo-hydrolase [Hydrogenophaga sp. A37]|uniref:MBL fold metallo-hydrolase n=1 Tax=Hydrogenophaga sp. A37 TaxID=1945864 RepID=UPI0009860032|nr:MBL fold metallo-hydrolase [Hydrogenophaga sp. A37]OOG83431.1 MBL fold metallo-hydrolase [Hydrogenophaga sp. A37]
MSHSAANDVLACAGVTVFERGWLSANNVLIQGEGPTALVDSGYSSHAAQTTALVSQALGSQHLDLLLNTHLHSDHCGGNAALKVLYPDLQTLIPPGLASAVTDWDEERLTYAPTGQHCPRFAHHGLLIPGTSLRLGTGIWQVHGAKGHDPHSIILFQPESRLLLSADALWQNGFGVVFPELEGQSAFDEVSETLDLIEALAPTTVVPGHGSVFQNVPEALERARSRLQQFRSAPERHLRHAHKVLIKFRLLEWQRIEYEELFVWAVNTPYLKNAMPTTEPALQKQWLRQLLTELEQSRALRMDSHFVLNA